MASQSVGRVQTQFARRSSQRTRNPNPTPVAGYIRVPGTVSAKEPLNKSSLGILRPECADPALRILEIEPLSRAIRALFPRIPDTSCPTRTFSEAP